MAYLPPVAHVIPMTTIRRARKLPVQGVIAVTQNERVQATDVIAEAQAAPKHIFIDVAQTLGVTRSTAMRYLRRELGDRVEKGDLLAGPVGLSRRAIRAPHAGRIVTVIDGKLLFEALSNTLQLRAGFPGLVIGTDGLQTVNLETTGALVHCAWGNEREDFGVMRLIGSSPADRLEADRMDLQLRGAVLVAGICSEPTPLKQAIDIAVRGVVLGSMDADLIPFSRTLPYPVVLTEGFGDIPINQPTYDLLRTNQGREISVNARRADPYDGGHPEIIIPLPVTTPMDVPEDLIALSPGVRVRVLRAPYAGMVGIVQTIVSHAVSYESGIMARSARVDLLGERSALVPLANLEVMQ